MLEDTEKALGKTGMESFDVICPRPGCGRCRFRYEASQGLIAEVPRDCSEFPDRAGTTIKVL